MTSKRVLRYWCDHCHGGGCNKSCMEKHEKRCIKNPNRTCGFCKIAELTQAPMSMLIGAFDKEGLEGLKRAADNCPACILAAIVQFNAKDGNREDRGYTEFNYKEAVAEFWREQNPRRRDEQEQQERAEFMRAEFEATLRHRERQYERKNYM